MKYQNIFGSPINVGGVQRQIDEVFETEETTELKNLVLHNYVKKIKEDKK